MKPKNSNQNNYSSLEKVVAAAGIVAVIVGCIGSVYSAVQNHSFINDATDLPYYYRYLLLLGGGFVTGALFARHFLGLGRYYIGVAYAVLAMAAYGLIDLLRLGLMRVTEDSTYLLSALFQWEAVLALSVTILIAYFTQYRAAHPQLSSLTKGMIVVSFVLVELYHLASGLYYLIAGHAQMDAKMPTWLVFANYLTLPLVIAFVSYLLLSKLKPVSERIFIATLIGYLYALLLTVLWQFSTNAEYTASMNFGYFTAAISLIFFGVILWRSRQAIK